MKNKNKHDAPLSELLVALEETIGKDTSVKLKNNIKICGQLKHFDQHLNIFLVDTDIATIDKTICFDDVLLRGSDVITVSLQNNTYTNPQ